MASTYTARAYLPEGRKKYSIQFRHPLKSERGRPGRKVCKGLGTELAEEATKIESQLNELLSRNDMHSVAARAEAQRLFMPVVVDIFFEDLDPAPAGHRSTRDRYLPLPGAKTHPRTLIMGITGAGKSSFVRRCAGTDTAGDRFPAVSVNRTTTCEIEVITGVREFSAVVTLLSQHQVQQEVTESLSAALLKGTDGAVDETIASEFLEQSDQRFRLKYVLGGVRGATDDEPDEFTFAPVPVNSAPSAPGIPEFVRKVIGRIRSIAEKARCEVENLLGPLPTLKDDDREFALDEMQRAAEQTDEFLDLVTDVMEEIRERFGKSNVPAGTFHKTPTGWPEAWTIRLPVTRRGDLIEALRPFSGIAPEQWGALLTPLVTGIRVAGPFKPTWVPSNESYDHVFIDTEGLLHAKTTTDIPSELTSRFKDVDRLLFLESAKNALNSPIAAKVFEAIASTGYVEKFVLLFTHMDQVSGDNLVSANSKKEHVFGGAKNILENHVARSLSKEAARQLATHLRDNTFYLGYLDPNRYPVADAGAISTFEAHLGTSLRKLTDHLASISKAAVPRWATPRYSFESLGLAVREASVGFQDVWEARLGYKRSEEIKTAKWQSVKAMSRRYAEGWFYDGYWLRPIDSLITITRNVLNRFLEAPLAWEGKELPEEQKTAVINRLKQLVNESLTEVSKSRLWRVPQTEWQRAYEYSGTGSTFERRSKVRSIFQYRVPVPESISDRWAQEWIDEVKEVITGSVEKLRAEQAEARESSGS